MKRRKGVYSKWTAGEYVFYIGMPTKGSGERTWHLYYSKTYKNRQLWHNLYGATAKEVLVKFRYALAEIMDKNFKFTRDRILGANRGDNSCDESF